MFIRNNAKILLSGNQKSKMGSGFSCSVNPCPGDRRYLMITDQTVYTLGVFQCPQGTGVSPRKCMRTEKCETEPRPFPWSKTGIQLV